MSCICSQPGKLAQIILTPGVRELLEVGRANRDRRSFVEILHGHQLSSAREDGELETAREDGFAVGNFDSDRLSKSDELGRWRRDRRRWSRLIPILVPRLHLGTARRRRRLRKAAAQREVARHRIMIGRLRRDDPRLGQREIESEKIIEGRVGIGAAPGMCHALKERRAFPDIAESGRGQFHQGFFLGELGLVEIGIEIAADHEAFHRRHRRRDHVVDVIEELIDRDLAFADVLLCLGRLVALHDQVAFEMERVNPQVDPVDPEPGKGEPARRVDPAHRFPCFRPRRLGRHFRENGHLLFPETGRERFPERGTDRDLVSVRRDCFRQPRANFVIAHFLQQDDVGIQRPENISRRRDAFLLFLCRQLFRLPVRKPFQVPGRDPDRRAEH